jgi:hypothetical protein
MAQELVPTVERSPATQAPTSGAAPSAVEQDAPTVASRSAHRLAPLNGGAGAPNAPTPTEARPVPVEDVSDALAKDRLTGDTKQRVDQMHILSKGKTLRATASKFGTKLGKIQELRVVLPTGNVAGGGWFERSWIQVRARTENGVQDGWINTKDSVENKPLDFSGEAEAIMDKSGPRPEDVKQGGIGDCYLFGPLMSLAQRKPQFIQNSLFRTDPTEPAATYTLEFYNDDSKRGAGPFTPERVSVRPTILHNQAKSRSSDGTLSEAGEAYGAKGPVLWPAIVEKAFLAWPNRNPNDDASGGQAHRAAGTLTGEVHDNRRLHASEGALKADPTAGEKHLASEKAAIIQALADSGSGALTASTIAKAPSAWADEEQGPGGASGELMAGGIAFGHVYSIVSANDSSITLRNPWGTYGRVNGKVVQDAAESVLSWEEFDLCFSGWSVRSPTQPRATPSLLPRRRG